MKLYVEPQEKSALAKELMESLQQDLGSFSEQTIFSAPIKNSSVEDIKEYWKKVHDSLIRGANKVYGGIDRFPKNNFEKQMETLVHHAIKRGPQDEDKSFGIYIGREGYVITYNDGSDFFKKPENKSEWESKFFNYMSSKEMWEKSYKSLGQKLIDEGPASKFAVDNQKGILYVYEDKRESQD